ncbi:MAG: cellulase family glycosylhydrolase [Fibrobacter sp.]|nr:cellulase family glycosylhydrolase [Fibrobacter sp.]
MNYLKKMGMSLLSGAVLVLLACSDDSSTKPEPADPGIPVAESSSDIQDPNLNGGSSSSGNPVAITVDPGLAKRLVANMGPGINLGNVFEAENNGFSKFDENQFTSTWGETIVPDDFKALGDSGFRNMRIPVSWEEHVEEKNGKCVVDEPWMKQVFWAVDLAIKNKMVVILNAHHWNAMYDSNPDAETPCLLEVYRQMMTEVVKYSHDSLIVETLNEPRGKLTSAKWNVLVDSIVNIVRTADPQRVVMVGTHNYNNAAAASQLKLPSDATNLIITFHYYEPFSFTHQGATFVSPQYPTGKEWKASFGEMRAIKKVFSNLKDWADAKGLPVYLGEFGAYEAADSVSRETWTTFMADLANKMGFGWAYWEFCSGFGVYDETTGKWNAPLMRALLHPVMTFEEAEYPSLDTLKYVLLDDFDQNEGANINVTALSAKLTLAEGNPVDSAAGRWYAYCDFTSTVTMAGGDTLVTSVMVDDTTNNYTATNFEKLITSEGHEGRGLYFKLHLLGDSYPWAGFGAGFYTSEKRANFANLKALTFWAKGKGEFKVSWVTDYAEKCCKQNWGTFSTEIELTSEWKQYTIWFDQWTPSPWSELEGLGAEWLEHNDDVRNLQFSNGSSYGQVVDEELEIWLDDVRFYGMSDADFENPSIVAPDPTPATDPEPATDSTSVTDPAPATDSTSATDPAPATDSIPATDPAPITDPAPVTE